MILSLFIGYFKSVSPQFCVSGQNKTFEKSFCVFGYVSRKRYVGKSTASGKTGTKKHLKWYRTDSRVDSRELWFRITKTFSPILSCHLPFHQQWVSSTLLYNKSVLLDKRDGSTRLLCVCIHIYPCNVFEICY